MSTSSASPLPPIDHHRIPNLLRTHVFYVEEGKPILDALVDIVFGEHGMPRCTLVLVRAGGGGVVYKTAIPHRDHRNGGKAYYVLPGEAIP